MPTQGKGLRTQPEQQRSRDRVESVLDAAQALLATRGLSMLTMSAIARESGTSVPGLYRYFPDRRAVVRALVLRMFDRDRHAVRGDVDELRASGPGALRDGMRLLLEQYLRREQGQPWRAHLWAAVAGDVELRHLDADDAYLMADELLPLVVQLTGRQDHALLRRQLFVVACSASAVVRVAAALPDEEETRAVVDVLADGLATILTDAGEPG